MSGGGDEDRSGGRKDDAGAENCFGDGGGAVGDHRDTMVHCLEDVYKRQAMAIASSSVSYGRIDKTGPKISSWAIVMSRRTSENTVGRTKYPFSSPSGASVPPVSSLAPSSMPFWM